MRMKITEDHSKVFTVSLVIIIFFNLIEKICKKYFFNEKYANDSQSFFSIHVEKMKNLISDILSSLSSLSSSYSS